VLFCFGAVTDVGEKEEVNRARKQESAHAEIMEWNGSAVRSYLCDTVMDPKYIPYPISHIAHPIYCNNDGNGNCQIYLGTLAIYRLSFIQFAIAQARYERGPRTATHETNAPNLHAWTGNCN
jgi:hypothetical protein